MPVLWAGLMREHHDFLGADPLGIDVGDDLEAGLFQFVQSEIRHFQALAFARRQNDASPFQHLCGSCHRRLVLFVSNHGAPSLESGNFRTLPAEPLARRSSITLRFTASRPATSASSEPPMPRKG